MLEEGLLGGEGERHKEKTCCEKKGPKITMTTTTAGCLLYPHSYFPFVVKLNAFVTFPPQTEPFFVLFCFGSEDGIFGTFSPHLVDHFSYISNNHFDCAVASEKW